MDSTVIQEIANQLGMAVDQAGQFIAEHLPDFAALKAMQYTASIVLLWVFFTIAAIVAIVAYHTSVKAAKKHNDDVGFRRKSPDDFMSFYVFVVSGIFTLLLMFIAIFVTMEHVPDIIGWSNYPEAMLIDMALKAV